MRRTIGNSTGGSGTTGNNMGGGDDGAGGGGHRGKGGGGARRGSLVWLCWCAIVAAPAAQARQPLVEPPVKPRVELPVQPLVESQAQSPVESSVQPLVELSVEPPVESVVQVESGVQPAARPGEQTPAATPPASTFEERLSAARSQSGEGRCGALEAILDDDLTEAQRRRVYEEIRRVLPRAVPELSARELDTVVAIQKDHPAGTVVLTGRFMIILATERFAVRAREIGLVEILDLAYIALREFFGVDPVRRVGRRYIMFPQKGKPNGHTINTHELLIFVGAADADNADWLDRFFHEMSHEFHAGHPGHRIFSAGFYEGYAEFCQALVPDRLAFLGQPFTGRFEHYSKHFPAVSGREYVETRLPVEEIIGYDPSAGLVMRLMLATAKGERRDWNGLRRWFRGAVLQPPPRVSESMWPAWMSRQYLEIFGEKARPVLAEYRFPLDEAALDAARAIDARERDTPGALEAALMPREALTRWRMLGPIPPNSALRSRGGIDLDPLDAENFVEQEAFDIGGTRYAWREIVADERGVVMLSDRRDQPAGTYYLVLDLPPEAAANAPTARFAVSSDDEAVVWVDGVRIYHWRGSRGAWPGNPDAAYARLQPGGSRVVAMVFNHGGPAAFYLARCASDPFNGAYARDLEAPAARERIVRFLGSRRVADGLVTPAFLGALRDPQAAVRREAAWALGGRRNDLIVVEALLAQWVRERDAAAATAMQGAVNELTAQTFTSARAASEWWERGREGFARSWSVEAEQAISFGSFGGGFYGNNAGASAGQSLGRAWGEAPEHWLGVLMEAREPGHYKLRVRAACPGRGAMRARVRRGDEIVAETGSVTLTRTPNWESWAWTVFDIGKLEAGRYRVELVEPSGSPDVDLLWWEPKASER